MLNQVLSVIKTTFSIASNYIFMANNNFKA